MTQPDPILPVLTDDELSERAAAVFDDIRATRNTDFVNNIWRVLANDPNLLEQTWSEVKNTLTEDSELDVLTKQLIYIAVSVAQNCNYCIRSHTAAARALGLTDAQLAELTGASYHACHVSTAESVAVVRWAKARGVRITAEVTPHHLLLDSGLLTGLDPTFKVNPPLRASEDIEALRSALADGTIDIVGTDHAPHEASAKCRAFASAKPGMLGLEQALAVVIETMVNPGRMTWAGLAGAMSMAPARIGRVPGQGRPLRPGEPANLVLVDPHRRAVVDREQTRSASRNNPYHGLDLPDPVEATMWAGRWTYRRGEGPLAAES